MSSHPLDQPTPLRADDTNGIPVVQPRKFAKNELALNVETAEQVAAQYEGNRLALHNDRDRPNFVLLEEKPEHRMIVYMVAEGKNVREIAELMRLSEHWVRQIKRQGWFKERLVEVLHEAGKDVVENFLQGEVLTSLETLVSLRDDQQVKAATRVSAANSILDRALGKPTQHIESVTTTVPAGKLADEVARLDREHASLQEQLKQAGTN